MKPEIVKCTSRSAPAIMLLEAMTRESKDVGLFEKFNLPVIPLNSEYVQVCLTINGVQVDFVKTAQEMWDRLQARHDEDVMKAAREMVQLTNLSRFESVLEAAQEQLEVELKKVIESGLNAKEEDK